MANSCSFIGTSKLTLSYEKGAGKSQHQSTDIRLDISTNMDKEIYLDEEGLPTKEAIKPLTQCFVQGLVANIHSANQKGWWKDADHLRYIISELERGFVQVAKVSDSTM